jgi:hypothetical protein
MFKQGEKLRTVYLLMDMALVTAVFVVEVLAAILMKSQNLI